MARPRINSALSQYKSISISSAIENATPHRLVQMLMAGALEKIAAAKGRMLYADHAEKGRQISWAISIISGLQSSLDMEAGGEISRNLDNLYDYMVRRLGEAGASNDPNILDEVTSLLSEVKSAWDAIAETMHNDLKQAAT